MFFVILTNTPNLVPGIFSVTELMYMPGIKIEARRRKRAWRSAIAARHFGTPATGATGGWQV